MKPSGWARPEHAPEYFCGLAVDPGLTCTGWSRWALRRGSAPYLLCAGYVPPVKARGPAGWLEVASFLLERVAGWGVDILVVETMQLYARGKGGPGVADDLLELQGIAGAVAATFRNADVYGVLPAEWKGQVPKAVTLARVEALLERHGGDWGGVDWPAPSLRHNVADAVGIGAHAFGV